MWGVRVAWWGDDFLREGVGAGEGDLGGGGFLAAELVALVEDFSEGGHAGSVDDAIMRYALRR